MIKNHTPGTVRYFTYYVIFPHDRDVWVEQVPFVHPLDFELKQSAFTKDPIALHELATKGETTWKDRQGVTHRVVIEQTKRNRKWGIHGK